MRSSAMAENILTGVIPVDERAEQLQKLYLDQKHTLEVFLANGAISKAQYDKSLGDLTKKMGMEDHEDHGERLPAGRGL